MTSAFSFPSNQASYCYLFVPPFKKHQNPSWDIWFINSKKEPHFFSDNLNFRQMEYSYNDEWFQLKGLLATKWMCLFFQRNERLKTLKMN